MKSYEDLLYNICTLKGELSNNPLINEYPLSEGLNEIIKILHEKKINIEEYLMHLWDEPDFQIRVLEEYCSDKLSYPLLNTFFFMHYTKMLYKNISRLKGSLANQSNIFPPLKKFVLDIKSRFDLLLKGTFSRISAGCFDNKRMQNITFLKTRNFHSFSSITTIMVTNCKPGAYRQLNKHYICCRDYISGNLIPLSNAIPSSISRKKEIMALDEFIDIIDNSTDYSIIDSILSSRHLLGSVHLYNEIRGIIIEKFFDTQKQMDIRYRYLMDGCSKIVHNIESLKESKNISIINLLDTASFLSTMAQIHYQIHRTNFYGIMEKLKVIYQKNNLNVDRIFMIENSVLFFNFLYIMNSFFKGTEIDTFTDSVLNDISDQFTRVTPFDKNYIRNNIESRFEELLSALESEFEHLKGLIFSGDIS